MSGLTRGGMRKRLVGLFGATLDPPTNMGGHAGVVAHFAPAFDELWVLPVFEHPFQGTTKRVRATFEQRVDMAVLAFAPLGRNVVVSDAERVLAEERRASGLDPVFGTMDLLDWLRARNPDTVFDFVLGLDALRALLLGKWRRSEELLRTTHIHAVSRAGDEAQNGPLPPIPPPPRANVDLVVIPTLTDVSSTRARAATTESELRSCVFPAVAEYVVRNRLYHFSNL